MKQLSCEDGQKMKLPALDEMLKSIAQVQPLVVNMHIQLIR